jgi:predicted lipoprotein
MRKLAAAIALLASALPASAAEETAFEVAVGAAIDSYVVPAAQSLAAASELHAATEAFCASPSAETVRMVDALFAETLQAWAGVDFLRFGPPMREGRYERFAYWPDVHGTGARQLRLALAAEDPALVAPGALAAQSAALQGLPALETFLYAGDDALLSVSPPRPYRCALAVAITANLEAIADAAADDWIGEDGWLALMQRPSEANPVYRSHEEAMRELLRALLTGLEQLRDQRLVPALGASLAEARAARAPYVASGDTIAYLAASASGLALFAEASGLYDLLPTGDAAFADSARFEFGNLEEALVTAGTDIEAALASEAGYGRLAYAAIVAGGLRDLFQNRIAPAIGLTAGFNSLDGD